MARPLLAVALAMLATVALVPAASAATGSPVRTLLNIRYAHPGGVPLDLDAYIPSGNGPFPAVIAVHGGSWSGGTKDWMEAISWQLALAGFVTFSIDYRLGPTYLYPAPVDDVRAAIAWAEANAGSFKVDPSRLAVLGTSAGGTLALLAALTGSNVKAVVSWSGATDLVALSSSEDPFILQGLMDFVGTITNLRALAEASPITYVGPQGRPTYLAQSTREFLPFGQATSMYRALVVSGIPAIIQRVQGDHHGTQLARWAMAPTIAFLKMNV
jgi:acetyl esterase/lipase